MDESSLLERLGALPLDDVDVLRNPALLKRVAGIDEAGRGPLAGPVVAAAVVLDPRRIPPGLDDSKRLSATRRAALFEEITANAEVAVGIATVEEIDRYNVLAATFLAMQRAVTALRPAPRLAIVDGNRAPALPCPTRAVVKADAKHAAVSAASIIAKETRDRLLRRLAEEAPGYGFERNMGYGTREHLTALSKLGPCPHHRRSFRPVAELLPPGDPHAMVEMPALL